MSESITCPSFRPVAPPTSVVVARPTGLPTTGFKLSSSVILGLVCAPPGAGVTHFAHRRLPPHNHLYLTRTPASIRTHTPPPHRIQTHIEHGALGNLTPWRGGASIKWAGKLDNKLATRKRMGGKDTKAGRIYAWAGHFFRLFLSFLFFSLSCGGVLGRARGGEGAFTTTDNIDLIFQTSLLSAPALERARGRCTRRTVFWVAFCLTISCFCCTS